jgi:hypothetical protein
MQWQTTYPALATINKAGFETICTWCDKLPPPQTDVERTVLRRLKLRRDQMLATQVRAQAPHIADKFNELFDKFEKIGIKTGAQRM